MALLILRVCFICVAAGIATLLLRVGWEGPPYTPYLVIFGIVLAAVGVIAVDYLHAPQANRSHFCNLFRALGRDPTNLCLVDRSFAADS